MARVTTIPATISRFTAAPINEKKKRRTAAYARVSTDSEEQLTSYTAQVDYYTNYIRGRDDWEFVGVYTDEGITGTNTKHREGFKRMVADALAGKIDLIVTNGHWTPRANCSSPLCPALPRKKAGASPRTALGVRESVLQTARLQFHSTDFWAMTVVPMAI